MSARETSTATSKAPPKTPPGDPHLRGALLFRVAGWTARTLPDWLLAPLIRFLLLLVYPFAGSFRRHVRRAHDAALGPAGWWQRQRRIYRTFHTFAWCLQERFEALAEDADGAPLEHTIEGLEEWGELLQSSSGFLLITAHIGLWEAGSLLAPTFGHRPVHVVREAEPNPELQASNREFFARLSQRTGGSYTVHFADGDPALGITLLHALRDGEVVALQGDRPRDGGRPVVASLFGQPYRLPRGPFALARSSGCPLVPIFVLRSGRRRARVILRPPIAVAPGARRGPELQAAADAVARELEAVIREDPYQWFCFHDAFADTENTP